MHIKIIVSFQSPAVLLLAEELHDRHPDMKAHQAAAAAEAAVLFSADHSPSLDPAVAAPSAAGAATAAAAPAAGATHVAGTGWNAAP